MGFFTQPWVLIGAGLVAIFVLFRLRLKLAKAKDVLSSLDFGGAASKASTVVQLKPKLKSPSKTTYRCRSCPQHFEPPNLFYVCPVCRSPVDKFENGVAVDEPNPAFPKASPASRHGTLPFIRRDTSAGSSGEKPAKAVQKPHVAVLNENVVALNLKAVDNLHRTCWLVVAAESGELAQNIAEHSANFRVLYRKSPKRLSKNRWLVWGKARSAA